MIFILGFFIISQKLAMKINFISDRCLQYSIALQAAVGSKILARSNIKELRKDVTAKGR